MVHNFQMKEDLLTSFIIKTTHLLLEFYGLIVYDFINWTELYILLCL